MPKAEKEKKFYVGLNNPSSIRRNLLEASKDIIKSLQRYEKSKSIRKEKIETIFEVRKIIRDIKKNISLLNSKLPGFPNEIKRKVRKEKVKVDPELKKEIEHAKSSELKKLEDELKNIEGELSKLGS